MARSPPAGQVEHGAARFGQLPDGSFISELVAGTDIHRREDVIPVRVIEYTIGNQGRPATAGTASYRLVNLIAEVLCDHPAHTRIRRAGMAIGSMPRSTAARPTTGA